MRINEIEIKERSNVCKPIFNEPPENFKELDKLAQKIVTDCSEFLSEFASKDVLLYRGINYSNNAFAMKCTNRLADRTPKNTQIQVHNALNKYFIDKFGWPGRNGIFVVANANTAAGYGDDTYAIFPLNGYKYIWSPIIKDLWVSLHDVISDYMEKHDMIPDDRLPSDEYNKQYFDYKQHVIDNEFKEALDEFAAYIDKGGPAIQNTRGNEMMLNASAYYAVNTYEHRANTVGVRASEYIINKILELST